MGLTQLELTAGHHSRDGRISTSSLVRLREAKGNRRLKCDLRVVSSTALLSFAAGSFITAHLTHLNRVKADNNRVELNVYHVVPGKVPALETRFREASKLLAKHDLNVVGYWVPDDDPAWDNTFIYIVAHPNRDDAEKNWDAFHADPAFQKYVQSEKANKIIEKVDTTFMRTTDYSPLK